ncbi:hypothetical protein [Amycolatopsis keratiniphila]|uniref:Uncharacterized protein n=1 Tax=Amycolatopsis keratiniphila subsp. keratiniphila TaxID=227715 RepID=A0A1W2LV55_9PSEU|nr:hypothetical protein [Amycolatopsis keratiniphila]ONF69964.1 hypothetical protein AVR91_0217000 [Amycolatopsis keratiniphila subsp. keratiniphila]
MLVSAGAVAALGGRGTTTAGTPITVVREIVPPPATTTAVVAPPATSVAGPSRTGSRRVSVWRPAG